MVWTVLNETVVPHEDLVDNLFTLERLMGVTYLMHNAMHSVSPASRPRLLGLEGASVHDIPASTHLFPNFVLKLMWNFRKIPVECHLAVGDYTRSPTWLYSPRQPDRHPDGDERDRMTPGSPTGASTGYGAVALSLKQRQRITGNAFSNDMFWGVMFQWTIHVGVRSTSMISQPTPLYAMSPQDCQMALSLLTAPDMFARFSGMVEPDLHQRGSRHHFLPNKSALHCSNEASSLR